MIISGEPLFFQNRFCFISGLSYNGYLYIMNFKLIEGMSYWFIVLECVLAVK